MLGSYSRPPGCVEFGSRKSASSLPLYSDVLRSRQLHCRASIVQLRHCSSALVRCLRGPARPPPLASAAASGLGAREQLAQRVEVVRERAPAAAERSGAAASSGRQASTTAWRCMRARGASNRDLGRNSRVLAGIPGRRASCPPAGRTPLERRGVGRRRTRQLEGAAHRLVRSRQDDARSVKFVSKIRGWRFTAGSRQSASRRPSSHSPAA